MLPGNHSVFLWCICSCLSSKNHLKVLDDNIIPFLCFSNLQYHLSGEKTCTSPCHHNCPFPAFILTCCCSVAKSWSALCDLVDCSTPGFPILHYLLEFAQTHVPWVGNAIQLSHPLSSSSSASVFPSIRVFSNGQPVYLFTPLLLELVSSLPL